MTNKLESIVIYAAILSLVALMEVITGFVRSNVHIIRDFILSALIIASIVFSYKMSQMARNKSDSSFSLGYTRLNLLAAFVNTVQILCHCLFSYLDIIHHVIEHWESIPDENVEGGHSHHHKGHLIVPHYDLDRQAEVRKYLSVFAALRLVIILIQIINENHVNELLCYLGENWIDKVRPTLSDDDQSEETE